MRSVCFEALVICCEMKKIRRRKGLVDENREVKKKERKKRESAIGRIFVYWKRRKTKGKKERNEKGSSISWVRASQVGRGHRQEGRGQIEKRGTMRLQIQEKQKMEGPSKKKRRLCALFLDDDKAIRQ